MDNQRVADDRENWLVIGSIIAAATLAAVQAVGPLVAVAIVAFALAAKHATTLLRSWAAPGDASRPPAWISAGEVLGNCGFGFLMLHLSDASVPQWVPWSVLGGYAVLAASVMSVKWKAGHE